MATIDWRVANTGSYPRVGDSPEHQRLRRAHERLEKGLTNESDLRAAQDEAVRGAIREQIDAGCDLVTDGLIRWSDAISHPLRSLPGVEINGLLRYFDTNTYFRQPVIRDRITPSPLGLVAEYRFATEASGRTPVMPVITGPYTLASLSIRRQSPYADVASLAVDVAGAIAKEIEGLARAGATVIQIDEPMILRHPSDIGLLTRLTAILADCKHGSRILLATGYGDAASLYERLQELPVDILGLDLTYGPGLWEAIARLGSVRDLCFGCVDARNTRLEKATEVARRLDSVRRAVEGRVSYLAPSSGLEYLPRGRAADKLKVLSDIRSLLSAG
jgi:5-methyltetrahydropteroyltriglutamate--homocysteine methyltransferase